MRLETEGARVLARAPGVIDRGTSLVAVIVSAIVEELDLTRLVRENVDLNEVAAGLDIEAILGRVDMIALADEIIDGVDLPDIIREASTSVTADVMTDVRSTSERADDAVANIVGRILRRRVIDQAVEERRDE